MKACCILLKAFSESIEIMSFLSLSPFMWFIVFIDLYILNYSLISGIKYLAHGK